MSKFTKKIPCRNKDIKIDKKTAYFMRPVFKDMRSATAGDLDFVYEYAFGLSAGYLFAGGITLAQREKLLDLTSYLYDQRKKELENENEQLSQGRREGRK